jgi:hypothetical protein
MTASLTDLDFLDHELLDGEQRGHWSRAGIAANVKRTPLYVFSPWTVAQIEQLDPSPN